MKRFMYLSIGVMCLMLSAAIGFHMGNRDARAQSGMVQGFSFDGNADGNASEKQGSHGHENRHYPNRANQRATKVSTGEGIIPIQCR